MTSATGARSSPWVLHAVRPRGTVVAVGVAVLVGSGLLGILIGPIGLSPAGILRELVDKLPFANVSSGFSEQEAAILWQLRMPRVVLGGLVGAMLAISGAAYQGVFRNPLADPFLLGVAAGAGPGATLALPHPPS